jgi:hypothetical protein
MALLTIFSCPPSTIMVEASDQRRRRGSMIFHWKLPVGQLGEDTQPNIAETCH